MTKLGYEAAQSLRGAIMWAAAGEALEAEVELGRIDPTELDLAVDATAEVLERLRRLREANVARNETAARVNKASGREGRSV